MGNEFNDIINKTKMVVGCEIRVILPDEVICTDDAASYEYSYPGGHYTIETSKLLNNQLIELIRVGFDVYLRNNYDYGRYFNDLIDGRIHHFINIRNARRNMVLIECEHPAEVVSMLQEVISDDEFVFVRDLSTVIMIVSREDIGQFCLETTNSIEVELMQRTKLAYSAVFEDINELGTYLDICRETLKIGKIFRVREGVYSSEDNRLEKLLCHLDVRKRKEMLGKYPEIGDLSSDEILTINSLFENELNLTKTAKAMYVHRNTLVYRIDKICNKVNLNILDFNDAMMLRVLLIIRTIDDNFN